MPGLFAMHSLVVYRLWANTYRHKEERLDVSNYGNKPLLDYILVLLMTITRRFK